MLKFLLSLVVGLCMLAAPLGATAEELLVYTSMKASLMEKIKAGLAEKHPEISLRYTSSGAGKLMAKIAEERQQGHVQADIFWTSEVPDFYILKAEGLLAPYTPADFKAALNPFPDYDGSFSAVRLGTLAIAYNTDKIKTPPATWQALAEPQFKGAFGIADPAKSGTAYMAVALLERKFGWKYFQSLADNEAIVSADSGEVVKDVAEGRLAACLAVDYIAQKFIAEGAPMGLAYPPQMLVVPSPMAIIKGSPHTTAARLFMDYLFSNEGQRIIAGEGTLPVRPDAALPEKYGLPLPLDALQRSIPINYATLQTRKNEILREFNTIMQHQ